MYVKSKSHHKSEYGRMIPLPVNEIKQRVNEGQNIVFKMHRERTAKEDDNLFRTYTVEVVKKFNNFILVRHKNSGYLESFLWHDVYKMLTGLVIEC